MITPHPALTPLARPAECALPDPDLRVRVAHCGRTCLVFDTHDDGLLVITTPARGLVPDGIVATAASMQRVIAQRQAYRGARRVGDLLPGLDAVPTICLRQRRFTLPSRHLRFLAHAVAVPHLPDLEPAALTLLLREPAAVVHHFLGAGIGATPAGDDILTGALAACAALGVTVPHTLTQAITVACPRTTRASATQMRAAMAAIFAQAHLDLVRDVAQCPRRALMSADRIGHSSGTDFLYGFVHFSLHLITERENKCQAAC